MENQLLKKYILNLFFILLVNNLLFGQVEYFAKVNPATCSYTIIDSLSGVKWISGGSSYNKINKEYIFNGQDVNHSNYLYGLDATIGIIISNPSLGNYFSLMKFDNASGILYGLHWTTTLSSANFVSINPTNLNYTVIRHISITGLSNNVTFDDANHRYIFTANDSIGNNCLFSVDATTGNVISKPLLSSSVSCIQFDNSSGNLYGLKWDNSLQTTTFVSINIANGNITTSHTIASVNSNYNYSAFDEINKRYTFVWTNSSNINYLYTINALNGNVVSNPVFPVFIRPYNLLEFQYDNLSGNLYALHWGAKSEMTGITEFNNENPTIKAYPNPAQQLLNIELPTEQTFNLLVYDVTGKKVFQRTNAIGALTIDCSCKLP